MRMRTCELCVHVHVCVCACMCACVYVCPSLRLLITRAGRYDDIIVIP